MCNNIIYGADVISVIKPTALKEIRVASNFTAHFGY